MLSPSIEPQMDYSGSALRTGLLNIKPIEVRETINRFGLKFRRTSRSFNYETPKSFEDYVLFSNNTIFEKIDIPERFEEDELIELFSQRSIKNYENDNELKQLIEDIKRTERTGRPLLSLILFIKDRFESTKDMALEIETKRFLTSNFSLNLFNKFVIFDNTFYDYMNLLEGKIRWYETRAIAASNFRLYSRHITEMKRCIKPFIDNMDSCFFHYLCLTRYITIWNSDNLEDILHEPQFLDINKVEPSKFKQLYSEFDSALEAFRQNIYSAKPEFLQKELVLKDSNTKKMFYKLLMLPSDFLRIG